MKRNLEMRKILTLLVLMTAAMPTLGQTRSAPRADSTRRIAAILAKMTLCLLYTSDAADE